MSDDAIGFGVTFVLASIAAVILCAILYAEWPKDR